MIKSNENDKLLYVNQALRDIYERKEKPSNEALPVYGHSSVLDYVAQAEEDAKIRSFLVHDQTEAFQVGLKVAQSADTEVIAALIPQRSVIVAGQIELVPQAYKPEDLKIAGHLAHQARQRRLQAGS